MSDEEITETYTDTFEICSSGRSSFNWEDEQGIVEQKPPKVWNKIMVNILFL